MKLTTLQKSLALMTAGAIVVALACPVGSHYSMTTANSRAEQYLLRESAVPDPRNLGDIPKDEYKKLKDQQTEQMSATLKEFNLSLLIAKVGNWSERVALVGLLLLWYTTVVGQGRAARPGQEGRQPTEPNE